ncbi:MAG: hypothetical protein MPJ50_00755, partial [Pirellulales bacterium]|nr:hypothetical protein [Pirellulales bacterium]
MNDRQLSIFEQLDRLCRGFKQSWDKGEAPAIEDYLSRIEAEARETLLRNLLPTDIRFLRKLGEAPSSEQYIQRFPDYARAIRSVFLESVAESMAQSTSHSLASLRDTSEVPPTVS